MPDKINRKLERRLNAYANLYITVSYILFKQSTLINLYFIFINTINLQKNIYSQDEKL